MTSRPVAPQPGHAGTTAVLRVQRKRDVHDAALVMTSLGIPHQTVRDVQGFILIVPTAHAAQAAAELESYRTENVDWPPKDRKLLKVSDGYAGAAAYVALLISGYLLQERGGFGLDWNAAGTAHAELVTSSEPWRAFTALSLHSGLRHIGSNLFFGSLFGVLVVHVLGTGLGWATIVLAGGLGNLLNAWIQSGDHRSIGASTAVFGALGALVACQWSVHLRRRRRWLAILVGLAMVGWLGVPEKAIEQNVDFMAHITGFAAGLLLGLGAGAWITRGTVSVGMQRLLAFMAAATIPLCWLLAFTR